MALPKSIWGHKDPTSDSIDFFLPVGAQPTGVHEPGEWIEFALVPKAKRRRIVQPKAIVTDFVPPARTGHLL